MSKSKTGAAMIVSENVLCDAQSLLHDPGRRLAYHLGSEQMSEQAKMQGIYQTKVPVDTQVSEQIILLLYDHLERRPPRLRLKTTPR